VSTSIWEYKYTHPRVTALTKRAQLELDVEKRRCIILRAVPAFAARARLLELFVRQPLEGFVCRVLQRVAECCRVLQSVADCYRVLQCATFGALCATAVGRCPV